MQAKAHALLRLQGDCDKRLYVLLILIYNRFYVLNLVLGFLSCLAVFLHM